MILYRSIVPKRINLDIQELVNLQEISFKTQKQFSFSVEITRDYHDSIDISIISISLEMIVKTKRFSLML